MNKARYKNGRDEVVRKRIVEDRENRNQHRYQNGTDRICRINDIEMIKMEGVDNSEGAQGDLTRSIM